MVQDSRDTHNARHTSPKPTRWLNQFAEKEADTGPFISMSKHWNAFSFKGFHHCPSPRDLPHRACRGCAQWRTERLRGIITYPLSKSIFFSTIGRLWTTLIFKNVATRCVLTRLKSSQIVFAPNTAREPMTLTIPTDRLGNGIPPPYSPPPQRLRYLEDTVTGTMFSSVENPLRAGHITGVGE